MPRHPADPGPRAIRPAAGLFGVVLLLGAGVGGWALVRADPAALVASPAAGGRSPGEVRAAGATPSASGPGTTGDPATVTRTSAGTQTGTPTATGTAAPRSLPAGLTAADVTAGLLSASFPQHGTGRLVVVPGATRAAGAGDVVRVRVEIEAGLKVDGRRFAAFALATLNDPRSWAHGGRTTFARTDGAADVRLVLASPDTSAAMCRPLRTYGRLSCHQGGATVLTIYRWVRALDGYGADRTGYRRYLVNHEVGHALGHGHVSCPGAGRAAPVMMQQTKGLKGCRPNPWPYP